MAAAHEFVEVRLLTDLRTGSVASPKRLEEEMDRLLGGSGHSIARRLGVSRERLGSAAARRRVRGVGPVAAGGVVAADESGGPDRGAGGDPHLSRGSWRTRAGPGLSGGVRRK